MEIISFDCSSDEEEEEEELRFRVDCKSARVDSLFGCTWARGLRGELWGWWSNLFVLGGWFIWKATTSAKYEESCVCAFHAVLLGEYTSTTLLPGLVLKEPCFHSECGLLYVYGKRNPKCGSQFIDGNCGAIVVCLCDCVMRESPWIALEDVSVAPWMVVLRSVQWLCVYLCMIWISVLINGIDLKVLYGVLYYFTPHMAAFQCMQRCLHNAYDHATDDCFV